jgi:hypothetical protein
MEIYAVILWARFGSPLKDNLNKQDSWEGFIPAGEYRSHEIDKISRAIRAINSLELLGMDAIPALSSALYHKSDLIRRSAFLAIKRLRYIPQDLSDKIMCYLLDEDIPLDAISSFSEQLCGFIWKDRLFLAVESISKEFEVRPKLFRLFEYSFPSKLPSFWPEILNDTRTQIRLDMMRLLVT